MNKKKCLAAITAAIIGTVGAIEVQAVIIAPGAYAMTIDETPAGGVGTAGNWNSSFTWPTGSLPSDSNFETAEMTNNGDQTFLSDGVGVIYGQTIGAGLYGSSDASDGVAGTILFNVDAAGIIEITSFSVDLVDAHPDVISWGEMAQWAADVSLMSGLTTASEFSLDLLGRLGVYQGPSGGVLIDLSGTFTTGTSCNSTGCITGTGVAAVPMTPNYTATLVSARSMANADVFEVWSSQATITYLGAVPIPAAVWLFGSGLLGLIGMARRKKS